MQISKRLDPAATSGHRSFDSVPAAIHLPVRRLGSICSALTGMALLAVLLARPAAADEGESVLEEVVVTAASTRLSGFQTATPVTGINRQDLENRGLTNIADYLNEIPSFSATNTPQTTTLDGFSNGTNFANLRGLGPNRTLVLVDRRRHVPVNTDGVVDLNVIPQALIDRVEVVTGGASAQWGSNAVAGVINFHTNRKLEGFRVETRYGEAGVGDMRDKFASMAFGMSSKDDRGHISIGGEYQDSSGITHEIDRGWAHERWGLVTNVADTGPNDGIPARIIARDVVLGLAADGGYLPEWAGNDPAVANIRFGHGGQLLPYDGGSVPAPQSVNLLPFQIGGDGVSFSDDTGLAAPYSRKSVMALIDYRLTDNLNLSIDVNYGESRSVNPILQQMNTIFLGGPTAISADNPFIPSDLLSTMTANGIPNIYIARSNDDFGFQTSDTTTSSTQIIVGLQGKAGRFDWDLYASSGSTDNLPLNLNRINQENYNFAVDAVTDPSTGEIVCRANVGGAAGAPGCVPLNLFGEGAPSRAALDYIHQTQVRRTKATEKVISASASGKVTDLPAGPLSVAFGAEYRRDTAMTAADKYFSPAEGTFSGKIDVTEGFLETGVPLIARDNGLALDLNAAIRRTDYSTSGGVTTWNAGLTFNPIRDLRFRGSLSRDIRAASIVELYALQQEFFGIMPDPFTGADSVVRFHLGGNPDLKPEKSDTMTFGIVYQPAWLQGFGVSADYYSIEIDNAIASIGPFLLIDRCFRQNICSGTIDRDPQTGAITTITDKSINVAYRKVKGVDLEAFYRVNGFAQGRLDVRFMATHVSEQSFSPSGEAIYDDAGVVSTSALGGNPTPKWRWSLTSDYKRGNYGAFAQVRYIGGGLYRQNYTIEDINDNTVSDEYLVNVGAHYDFNAAGRARLQMFVGANNVFDQDPPRAPVDFLHNIGTNPGLYDMIGRYWYAGFRASY